MAFAAGNTVSEESAASAAGKRKYAFRGDDNYRGGPVGKSIGVEADAADIQNFAEHVLRKESNRSSRYTSFTEEARIARKFTSDSDRHHVRKAEMAKLRELEAQGTIKILDADEVFEELMKGPRKLARQAADVRTAMSRNCEILIEGQIPEHVLEPVN